MMEIDHSGMSVAKRLALVATGFAVVVALLVVWVAAFLRSSPPTVAASSSVSATGGTQAYLTLQTVGSIGTAPRPTWVSYLVRDADGKWIHSTVFQVPAHATVHVTVLQYDSAGALRNPHWSQVFGTLQGGAYYTGAVGSATYKKPTLLTHIGPADAGHTFAVPGLGVYVPLAGISSNAPANSICGQAPCTTNFAHNVVQFSFKTGAPHIYRWQCFVPCGLDFLDGNGGPMQTLGYMMGFIKVA
jgi:hypothetical protein